MKKTKEKVISVSATRFDDALKVIGRNIVTFPAGTGHLAPAFAASLPLSCTVVEVQHKTYVWEGNSLIRSTHASVQYQTCAGVRSVFSRMRLEVNGNNPVLFSRYLIK